MTIRTFTSRIMDCPYSDMYLSSVLYWLLETIPRRPSSCRDSANECRGGGDVKLVKFPTLVNLVIIYETFHGKPFFLLHYSSYKTYLLINHKSIWWAKKKKGLMMKNFVTPRYISNRYYQRAWYGFSDLNIFNDLPTKRFLDERNGGLRHLSSSYRPCLWGIYSVVFSMM